MRPQGLDTAFRLCNLPVNNSIKRREHKLKNEQQASSRPGRKAWISPEFRTISAGSAEARQRDGLPDGGSPGTSRS